MSFESLQENQVYLECIGTSGSFGMVAQSLEFLSNIKLRPPPLEVQRNAEIPFQMKQGNGPSSRDEEGKTRLFLSCGGTLGVPLKWKGVSQGTS